VSDVAAALLSGKMSRRRTPLFPFETASRKINLSNRWRGPTAREILDSIIIDYSIVPSNETPGDTTQETTPASDIDSAGVAADNNFEPSSCREAQ